jgi:DNA-binding SARP family transcriptional activator
MKFLILGPLEVQMSGGPVRVGGQRQHKLLALLLLNVNRTVSTERVIMELWESPPDSVRQQIHNAVGKLRRTLVRAPGDPRITTTDVGYRLETPEESIDLYEFRHRVRQAGEAESAGLLESAVLHLRASLDLWRGTALLGLDSPTIASAAAKLNEERLTAIESMMSIRLRVGQWHSIIGELRELVAQHPFRESLRGYLMVALSRSGRQAEALAAYDEGRELLADELGLDPGTELRSLHADILKGITEPANTAHDGFEADESPKTIQPAAAAFARSADVDAQLSGKCYLPNDTGDFSGRSAELVQLLAQAQQKSSTALVISAIDGMGGVGKTTLAVRFAHSVAADYPDGQYFIDLRGFTSGVGPVTSAEALDSLLRDSGIPPEIIPLGVDARLAMWRARSAGMRALIVFDNVADATQVRPLLPGTAGTLVLITSRRKLTALEGTAPLSLDVLPLDEALALFTRIVGTERTAERAAVTAAVELCGRLPLAIRIAAARLRDRRSWTVAHLVERLEDQAQRSRLLVAGDRNVMTVLKMSYRYLGPQQQRLFRLLSLHPGTDFDAYAAAALAGLDLEDAENMLETLLDDNLLRQDVVGRYYFHDLVRDCARELCRELDDKEFQHKALQLLFDYYLCSGHVWCKGMVGAIYAAEPKVDALPKWIRLGTSELDSLGILHAEYGNIAAIIRYAHEHGWHSHAWQLAGIVQPYLKLRNYSENARQLFEWALQSARADHDVEGESVCLNCMVAVCREHGSIDEAQEYLDQAIRLNKAAGNSDRETGLLIHQGTLHMRSEKYQEAYDSFRTAERMSMGRSDDKRKAVIANNLGVICRVLGRFDQSFSYFHEAMELARSARDSTNFVTLIRWNMAMVHHLRGEHQEASRGFGEVLDISRRAKHDHGEILALAGLTSTLRSLGDLDTSIEHGRRALNMARELRLHELECEALNALAETTVSLKEFDRAAQIYEQAQHYAREHKQRRYAARALEGLAHVAWLAGSTADARQYWEQAVDTYPKGMVYANYARVHLAALNDRTTTCFRCATAASR